MNGVLGCCVVLSLLFAPALPAETQPNQLLQGTQLRLTLLSGLSTSVARDGDPFTAVVAEPVYVGGQLVLPAGARVRGNVGTIYRSRRFPVFRGQAAMNLIFHAIEVDRREYPAQMSILSIRDASTQASGRRRKDLKVEEGQLIQARADIKGYVTTVGLGTVGGTATGAVFSHVVRGLTLGLVGSTVYVMARKGHDVELPAQTALLVRLDNNVSVPTVSAAGTPHGASRP